jgi:serine/threonine protein kinase/Tol biopolymer transport system component
MGEVYRAKDTRLGRDVAIKILPAHLSDNTEVRERFEREARAISSLNHPNICTLYDIGREGDADYFVMELLEGETLSVRLERGPLKLEEALRISAQIADGLGAAHKQGIIHRDLKPSNIALGKTGAKILDFGIAKRREEAVLETVTRTTPLTSQGTMLGTVQYMAPEQLEGKPVDQRADFFSLGAVLYEMVTGQRAFTGQSQASVIAAILREDPRPVSQLMPTTPVSLDRVIASCLAKDPDDRWHSAGDLSRELRWIAGATGATGSAVAASPATERADTQRRVRSASVAWTLAGLASLAAVASIAMLATRRDAAAPRAPLSRFSIYSHPDVPMLTDGAQSRISPDGRNLVFVASPGSGAGAMWLRPLDELQARPIPGTEDGQLPFWSANSKYIGFFGNGKLSKVQVTGGAPEIICNAGDGRGATWNKDGVIVFSSEAAGPLSRVSENGGDVVPVTELDVGRKETAHRWPQFLPDGKHFLYVSLPPTRGLFDVFVGSIDSMERKRLLAAGGAPIYAPPGYLIYAREGTLVAQPFDAAALKTTGEPVSLGPAPAPSSWTGAQVFSASGDGLFARWGVGFPNTVLEWYDRAGKKVGDLPVPEGRYENVYIAPDGKRVAVIRRSSVTARDIWLIDVDHPVPARFTFGPSQIDYLAWSPDGSRIAFESDRFGPWDLFVKSIDGGAAETPVLLGGSAFKQPTSWTADGKSIVFEQSDPKTGWDLVYVAADGKSPAVPYLNAPYTERQPHVSPDGRWIAYGSDESGKFELFVQSFPVPGAKYQLTSKGINTFNERWTKNGKEFMFLSGDGNTVMAVDVTTGSTFRAGAPRALFKMRTDAVGYDFTPDGERVLATVPAGTSVPPSITIDVNWASQLAK